MRQPLPIPWPSEALARAFSASVGIVCALAIARAMPDFAFREPALPERAPVRFAASPPKATPVAPPAPSATLPIAVPEAPRAKPRRPSRPAPPQATKPDEPAGPLLPPEVENPAFALPAPPAPPALPAPGSRPPDGAPPAPPEIPELPPIPFDDLPGGKVTLIAVLVNHMGEALAARLVIVSNRPLDDLGAAMVARSYTFQNLEPPLAPGQKRWLFLRLEQDFPALP